MISFRHKSSIRQVKIKTKKDLAERMPPWLQQIFGMKNPVVGFKAAGNKYYDSQSFYAKIDKFYGQIVDIIEANDQLQISFISQNLNSSSFIKPNQHYPDNAKQFLTEEYPNAPEDEIKIIKDVRSLQEKLKDNSALTIFFDVHEINKKEVAESATELKNANTGLSLVFFMRNYSRKTASPTYSIYIGKKLIATLNLNRQYKETIQMVIERYSKKMQQEKSNWIDPKIEKIDKIQKGEEREYVYKGSYEQENEAPSFTTYQLQERLNQDACQDYLLRMYHEKILKKYEYLKLAEKCQQNFIEFYRIFCQGAIDNDYENFRNQILMKVQNNLQILLSNVDEMDLSRPISREDQRRQNLKKSVSNIEIVKVQNYFEILDQLKPFLTARSVAEIKVQLLDQNQIIFNLFSDYLSRKISKEQLAASLDNAVEEIHYRKSPTTRGISHSANRVPLNQSDDIIGLSPIVEQPAKPIKFLGMGSRSNEQKPIQDKPDKNQPKQTPPMFGSSKNEGNFSPIKYMSDIQSNYKQAWSRLENKAHLFEPQEYGLLYYYLQARDDSISNIIQEMQWDQHSSIEKLREHLSERIKEIMKQNFSENEISAIELNKKEPQFQCIYQNFKYQSDLNTFLSCLKSEVNQILGSPAEKVLRKKKSDGQLLGTHKSKDKGKRRYSDEQQIQCVNSPKSSFSHSKTIEGSIGHLEIMNAFWVEEFEEMMKQCDNEQYKDEYIRNSFKEGNPAVYNWIHKFIRNKEENVTSAEIKRDRGLGDYDYKLIGKVLPIFNEILRTFVEQGKISEKIKQWHISQIVDVNITVLAIFEEYIQIMDEKEFVQNLIIAFEAHDKQMFFYKLYLKRIEAILKEMSAHDEIGLQMFKMYPEKIKAICELFYVTGDIEDLLENLDVMHSVEVTRRKLKVATLNFSGINTNPLEYHDGTQVLKELNEVMKQIIEAPGIKEYLSEGKSKIDKNFTNNSVSIRFGTKIIDQNKKLLNKQEYMQAWRQQFQAKASEEIKKECEQNKIRCATFDYYCYITLVKYFTKVDWNENYEIPNIKELNPEPIITFLTAKQNQPASKLEIKQQTVLEYLLLNNIDVLFLQEGGSIDWGEELVSKYHWVRNKDSVIIFNKEKIGKAKNSKQLIKYAQKLNFNGDSVHFFSDRGYLLISAHLTSKKNKTQQGEQVFNVLNQIQNEHPMMKIIVGIDANHFMGTHQNIGELQVYPRTSEQHTSTKMRTYLQFQFHKADQLATDVKDHIISSESLKEYFICTVDGKESQDREYLPNDKHPYDHLIVQGYLEG